VTLGWETSESAWDAAIQTAISGSGPEAGGNCWIVQERIPSAAKYSRTSLATAKVEFRDMLVDFAPYLFHGKLSGYLTR